jgi:spermidine synthase
MKPWKLLDKTEIPNGGGELELRQREDDFSISLSGKRGELMNSRMYNSEEALAKLGCAHLKSTDDAQILVGGLGMGFTLAAALKVVSQSAKVTVAELIPAVVEWNRGALGERAGKPLLDGRVLVYTGDVVDLFNKKKPIFDAVLLDVDNGPEGLTNSANQRLYSLKGLKAIYNSLHTEGMLAIWSASPDNTFLRTLKKAGFKVTTQIVRARVKKGSRHTIFLAKKP